MANTPFQWVGNQAITSPEAAKRQRDVAAALLANNANPKNWTEGLSSVLAGFSANKIGSDVNAAEEAGRSSAAAALAGIGPSAGFSDIASALANPWISQPQASIASALLQQNLERQDPMYQAQLAKLQAEAANGGQGNESFFGNIVPMQDANGNVVLGQASNQGNWQPLQGADGYTPAPTTKQIDTGTEIITTDIYGNELYRTPKQNREAAYQTGYGGVEGKTAAENAAETASIASKMPGVRAVVAELNQLAEQATYTQSGQFIDNIMRETGQEPTENALARAKYIAMVDNQVLPLLKDTFGAAFTVQEGESLRATLGNPNASPQEKKAILEAFIEQKERDVAARTGQPTPGTGQGVPSSPIVRTFNPTTGRLE